MKKYTERMKLQYLMEEEIIRSPTDLDVFSLDNFGILELLLYVKEKKYGDIGISSKVMSAHRKMFFVLDCIHRDENGKRLSDFVANNIIIKNAGEALAETANKLDQAISEYETRTARFDEESRLAFQKHKMQLEILEKQADFNEKAEIKKNNFLKTLDKSRNAIAIVAIVFSPLVPFVTKFIPDTNSKKIDALVERVQELTLMLESSKNSEQNPTASSGTVLKKTK